MLCWILLNNDDGLILRPTSVETRASGSTLTINQRLGFLTKPSLCCLGAELNTVGHFVDPVLSEVVVPTSVGIIVSVQEFAG